MSVADQIRRKKKFAAFTCKSVYSTYVLARVTTVAVRPAPSLLVIAKSFTKFALAKNFFSMDFCIDCSLHTAAATAIVRYVHTVCIAAGSF